MPRFDLSEAEVRQLVEYFAGQDRIPKKANRKPTVVNGTRTENHASGRLVGSDGFNCASCHSIGQYEPADAPINTRGPNLTAVVDRVRPEWFARWVRNPIRIVPNVEMPSIRVPVKGVLNDDLDLQVAAVWNAIRDPKFTIPEVRPFRILRQSGIQTSQAVKTRSIILTDVLKVQHQDDVLETHLKPFAVGLPNRHNILFDLGSGGLAGWWLGDLAGQINKGKRWHWQANVRNLLAKKNATVDSESQNSHAREIVLIRNGRAIPPARNGQFVTRADSWRHIDNGVELNYRLRYETNDGGAAIRVRRRFATSRNKRVGFVQTVECSASKDETIRLLVGTASRPTVSSDHQQLTLDSDSRVRIMQNGPETGDHAFSSDGAIELQLRKNKNMTSSKSTIQLEYTADLNVDYYELASSTFTASSTKPETMNVVPGFAGKRLPVNEPFMPTGLTWGDDGNLFVASLDGRVWRVADTDEDGYPDRATLFGDELSTPYGIVAGKGAAGAGFVDVVDKTALLRLRDLDGDGRADESTTLAAGWGHTDDYHDWVVGLEADSDGNYYVAIPCQQDERPEPAAYLRGKVLQLSPRVASTDQPEHFSIRKLTGGHRFPHGIARSRDGDLFVTDNQGNFNPFNELNHVVAGRRYGFINQAERNQDFKPKLTPPAINIPHPWTRSVNGICFLESPAGLSKTSQPDSANRFGPFEGHIVGCEYDTRRLVRMSLQRIGKEYQGGVYPFSYDPSSIDPSANRSAIPGPIVCEIGPNGDLYVGSLRESGWGGGKNTGEIVRLTPKIADIPAGIAEIRASTDGFEIEFTKAIDQRLAADLTNYQVMSYTRISTPKYGGDDVDRREEKVASVRVVSSRLVHIQLQDERRIGYVYEFRLSTLVERGEFFPSEGYYTLNRLP